MQIDSLTANPQLLPLARPAPRQAPASRDATFAELLTASPGPASNTETAPREAAAKSKAAFEKMVVAQLVGELFSAMPEPMLGGGMEGDMYRSLYSDAIAEQLAGKLQFGFSGLL